MATVIYQQKAFNMEIVRVWDWVKSDKEIRSGEDDIRLIAKNNVFEGTKAHY